MKKMDECEQSIKTSSTLISSTLPSTLSRLRKQVQAERAESVKMRIESNSGKLQMYMAHSAELSETRGSSAVLQQDPELKDMLTVRIQKALCRLSIPESTASDKESGGSQEDGSNMFLPIIFGSTSGGKSVVRPIKLPAVQRIPPYTTWIFLDRNQRMTEDQSVLGRRRIYYDQSGGEALICSDSEEELGDDEEEKHEFSKGEGFIIWMAIQEHGFSQQILDALGSYVEAKPAEVEARYSSLVKEDTEKKLSFTQDMKDGETNPKAVVEEDKPEDKDLDAAMDSFDNLFCRRCLVFDCRLHGCSQSTTRPNEKQSVWTNPEGSLTPCGLNCHLLAAHLKYETMTGKLSELETSESYVVSLKNKDDACNTLQKDSSFGDNTSLGLKRHMVQGVESACSTEKLGVKDSNLAESVDASIEHAKGGSGFQRLEPSRRGRRPGRKSGALKKNLKRRAEEVLVNIRKRQCRVATSDTDSVASGGISPMNAMNEKNGPLDCSAGLSERLSKRGVAKTLYKRGQKMPLMSNRSLRKQDIVSKMNSITENKMVKKNAEVEGEDGICKIIKNGVESVQKSLEGKGNDTVGNINYEKAKDTKHWSLLEKGLYEKGVEIFGKNSCLIARNMLKGSKTCVEVAEYILEHEAVAQRRMVDGHNSHMDGTGKLDCSDAYDAEVRPRTRFWRKRGRVRRLKYTWKSAGHPAIRKWIADGKNQPCKQYTPCGCQFSCGKQCPCLRNGTCCEKYCGCSKSCKNRFRGCHCAKSQCRSRQCPCFAAGRECDPDVCRNCWVGCGDGTLGGPPQRGDNYECRNMKLLLKQQQRVLLGRSDVAGWGAFLKNPVSKHDYLGEYTGELISHREADKRGKIYDRENSSFLFNLNDQYVLDAYRKGDKLKFANHSPNPNCYAKVIMVAGDHRVGIFAKERISSGEELFYDYRYEPDRAPAWARKPENSNVKRDEPTATGGRAQKVA